MTLSWVPGIKPPGLVTSSTCNHWTVIQFFSHNYMLMNQKEDAAFHAQNNYIVWVKTAQQSKFWPWQLQLGTVFMIIKFKSQNVEISEVNIFLQNTINTLKAYKAPSPICLSLPTSRGHHSPMSKIFQIHFEMGRTQSILKTFDIHMLHSF